MCDHVLNFIDLQSRVTCRFNAMLEISLEKEGLLCKMHCSCLLRSLAMDLLRCVSFLFCNL